MSLSDCLKKANSTKQVFSAAEIKDIQARVNKNAEKLTMPAAEAAAVKEILDAAIAERDALKSTIMDALPNKSAEADSDRDYADRIHTLSVHDDVMKRANLGSITADEFRSAFDGLMKNNGGIKDELGALTKLKIFDRFPSLAYRYKNENKDTLIAAAYRDMQDDFTLGEGYSYGMSSGSREASIKAIVDRITDESLAKHAESIKAAQDARAERAKEVAEGIENPQTLDDFQRIIAAKAKEMGGDVTFGQVRMTLPLEQRIKMDELAVENTRKDRAKRKESRLEQAMRAPGEAVDATEIIKTRHTKHGHDLWQFQLVQRVAPDEFKALVAQARRLGGDYSSYRGNGAIPGWQFRTEDAAKAFKALVAGDAAQAKELAQERRDAYADDRSQTAVERLTEMADSLDARADESLNRDRKENTARRARFAAAAEASANADKAMAQTMRNIAKGIEDGTAKLLDQVRQKIQVEMLQGFVNTALSVQQREKYGTYAEQEKHRGELPTVETADYANFPTYTAYRSDLANIGRVLIGVEGTKKLGQRLMKVADDVSDAYLKFAKDNIDKVSTFKTAGGARAVFASKDAAEQSIERSNFNGKAIVLPVKRGENAIILSPAEAIKRGIWEGDNDKRITLSPEFGAELVENLGKAARRGAKIAVPWQFENAYEKRKRLAGINIETPAELRAALREYIGLREAPKEADKIKKLERAMIGRKNDDMDFFPTPAGVADEMIEAADIKEGMSVLEPSAGMGHIADRIREADVEPDVVELSSDRRELLEAKGYNIAGYDFMDMQMKDSPDGAGYDRIIMNPPFGDRRDAEHVMHAYELLKPGGRIVAIMGEGVFFGNDKAAKEFREWQDQVGGTDEKLEAGTFMDPSLPVNTGVSARMVVIDKPVVAIRSEAEGGALPLKKWLSEAAIAEIVDERLAQFSHQAPVIIRNTERDVLGDASRNDGIATSGMVYRGKIYVFRDGLVDAAAVTRTIWHESLHYGLRRFLTKEQYISKLGDLYMRDSWIRKQANAWLDTDQGKDVAEKHGPGYARARGVDEALADLAEADMAEYQNNSLLAKSIRTVARWISKLADTFGFKDAAARWAAVTNDEARDLVRAIFQKLKADEPATSSDWAFTADPAFMVAWHGSPHDHDKFDSSKIGTGEGAQAYGYGLYFADNKEVGEYYRKNLSAPDAYSVDSALKAASKSFKESGYSKEEALEGMKAAYPRQTIEDIKKAIDLQYGGRLYQVELAPKEDEYLLWDKPLSEQSDMVKKALGIVSRDFDAEENLHKKAGELGVSPDTLPEYEQLTQQIDAAHEFTRESGEMYYLNLSEKFAVSKVNGRYANDKAASEYLHSQGIRGIKYLDGSSRSKGEGRYNYVIFNDEDVSITAKFSRNNGDRGMSVSAVETVASPIAAKLKNIRAIKVVDSQLEIPGLKKQIEAAYSRYQDDRTPENLNKYLATAKNDIEGAYVNGELYLVASNFGSAERVEAVLRHEVAHLSVEQMLEEVQPGLYDKLLNEVIMLDGAGNKYIRALAAAVDKTQPGLNKRTRAAEIIAQIAERSDHDKEMPRALRSLWQRIADGIRAFYKLVFDIKLTDQDVRDIVAQSFRWARGEGDAVRAFDGQARAEGVKLSRGDEDAGRERYRNIVDKLKELYGGEEGYESLISGANRFLRKYASPSTRYHEQLFAARKLKTSSEAVQRRLLEQENATQGSRGAGEAAFATLESRGRRIGHFNGYVTEAGLQVIQHYGNHFEMEVWPAEFDGSDGALDAPILRLTINPTDATELSAANPHGELVIYGPAYNSQTFAILQKKGWAEVATGQGGKTAYLPDGTPWTRLTGVTPAQLTALLAEAHARIRLATGAPHLGINWDRATGATGFASESGDKDASRKGAMYFSRAADGKPLLRPAKIGGIENDISLADKAFSLPFKLLKWDKLVAKPVDILLEKTGELIPETVKAGIVSNYGLPTEYTESKDDMRAREAAMNRKAHGMVEMLAGLNRAESRVAYYWMQEKPGSAVEQKLMEQLPEASRETLDTLKTLISDMGKEAVRLGQMSPEAYERNNMAYLHRTYAKHVLAEEGKIGQLLRRQATKIKGYQYKGRGIFDEVGMSSVGGDPGSWRKLQEGRADKSLIGEKLIRFERRDASAEVMDSLPGMTGKSIGKLREVVYWPASTPVPQRFGDWVNSGTFEVRDTRGDMLVVWRDLTREERERLGELDEVRYAVAQTLQMMIHDIEVGRFLEWTAKEYGRATPEGKEVAASESMLKAYQQEDWVQVPNANIPDTRTKKYGALSGMYVPGAIWNDIRQTAGGRIEPLGKTYASVLRFWKKSKTVWSPGVHMNNVMGNFVMADWHDMRAVDLADALRVWAMNDKPGYKELFDRFQDSGALGGMFQSNEVMRDEIKMRIEEMKADLKGEQDASKEMGTMAKVLHLVSLATVKPVNGYANVTAKAYQSEDEVFRLAMFLKAVRHGKTDIEAGRMARHAFLNYEINAPWVQAARQTVLPFMSFFYRAAPMLLETAKNKPWKIVKLMSFAALLNALGYAVSGGDEDKERKLLPDEKSGSIWGVVPKMIRMPWNHGSDDPVFLDVRRWVPVGDVADMEMGSGMLPPWATPSGPLMVVAEAALINKSMFTKKDIAKDTDTFTEKTEKRLDLVFKSMMPNVPLPNPVNMQIGRVNINPFSLDQGSMQSYSWSGIEKAVDRRENAIGEVRTTPQAVINAVGVKIGAYPLANMKAGIALEFEQKIGEIKAESKKALRDYARIENPTPAQTAAKDRELVRLREKIEKEAKKVAEKVN